MWEAAELTFAVALSCVLVSAGLLKLNRDAPTRDGALASLEILIGGAVLLGSSRPIAFAAGLMLGIGFTAYAVVRPDRPCRCFGSRLQATGPAARVVRASSVAAISLVGFLAWTMTRTAAEVNEWIATSILLGLFIGGLVVAVPALASGSKPVTSRQEGM